ncbi:hypothetical protein H696_05132 [Fonticula alba]|uniref:Uncharacterized protein n=1 Tax=Fonticula alba TaxID=691883 RepID=A0A058Z1R3_FONAL|nr:hypothetical protein H696_05132 [Fonticula alba]KCV68205.1 hypothetical protein H696_05132 [Fonticula alba]|eukprot:XP_009497259.1 hypothetical protein H696_05132 [Fonticula alba]
MSLAAQFAPHLGYNPNNPLLNMEKEEQNAKFTEIIQLLLAAGYFRARINTLSEFDRVIGGLAWGLAVSASDVDVDVINISEKITRALQRLKCPHPLEPHQIQGLNFIYIFPVIQWLVKRVIAARAELGDSARALSTYTFDKHLTLPDTLEFPLRRLYRAPPSKLGAERPGARRRPVAAGAESTVLDTAALHQQVNMTLLEFGHRQLMLFGGLAGLTPGQDARGTRADVSKEEATAAEQEQRRRVEALMEQMHQLDGDALSAGTDAALIKDILMSGDAAKISALSADYSRAHEALAMALEQQLSSSGVQAFRREKGHLERQIANAEARAGQTGQEAAAVAEVFEAQGAQATRAQRYGARLIRETKKLDGLVTEENAPLLARLEDLLSQVDALEGNEARLREDCIKQLNDIKQENLELEAAINDAEAHDEMALAVEEQHAAEWAKLQRARRQLARKNRAIALIRRKLDDIPSRPELAQYQARFLELHAQVTSKLTETRQYYALFNALEEQRVHLQNELDLLNNVHSTFERARQASRSVQDSWLESVREKLEIAQKVDARARANLDALRSKRDVLHTRYMQLIDLQREYDSTVIAFQEACRRNEELQQAAS